MMHAIRTTLVPVTTCGCVGHSTFLSSAEDSRMKRMTRGPPRWGSAPGVATGAVDVGAELALVPDGAEALDVSRASRRARRCVLVSFATRAYLVSLCGVCLPHQRQYLLNSTRSGSFRFDFWVW